MIDESQSSYTVKYLQVDASHAGRRIDNFLCSTLKGLPKSRLYRIIRKGEVRVNKKRIEASYHLVVGDIVRVPPVRLGEKQPNLAPSKQLSNLLIDSVCYEDDRLLVINKPAGMAVHGGSGVSLGVIEALRAMHPKWRFLELVHRLDRETSGCLMLAKRRAFLVYLHDCLRAGRIKKTYYGLVKGKWHKGEWIDAPLRKFVLPSSERRVKVDSAGKTAQTQVKVLGSYRNTTLLALSPITGRTHQLRVHSAWAGHPLVGDTKYGDEAFNEQAKQQSFHRLFLHAHQLIVPLPEGQDLTLTCEMPQACQDYLLKLQE